MLDRTRIRKAYLEVSNGLPFDDFVYISITHLIKRGFDVIYYDQIDNDNESSFFKITKTLGAKDKYLIKPTKDDIFIGSVESTKRFFNFIGVKTPDYIGYPRELESYYKRNIKLGLIKDLEKENLPIFIKPSKDVKLFTGFLLENKKTLENISTYYDLVTDRTEVYISEPIKIVSEYRCFVNENKLVGIKNYEGSFSHFIDVKKVNEMIEIYATNPNKPICYTLDVALDDKGQTILIEINDFWAIGSYGLDGKEYVSMIIKRIEEIKKKIN